MGKYLSPDDPNEHTIKCAIIFYPDDSGAFFLSAVRGQLSELARPFVWEGNRAKQDLIAQIFTKTDMMTDDVFFGLDCELIPLITGEEDMNINVNCNCGCCGTSNNLYCVGSDGQTVISPQTPVDYYPEPPDGLTFPFDPENDIPPEKYSDWQQYDEAICLVANWMWFTARLFLTTAETLADYATAITAMIVVIVPFLPVAWVAAASSWTITQAVGMLVKLFASEQATDILNGMVDWLDDEKEEIICFIYSNRYDYRGIPAGLIIKVNSYIEGVLSMSLEEETAVSGLIQNLFFWTLFVGAGINRVIELTESDVPDIFDCLQCADDYVYSIEWPLGSTTWPDDLIQAPSGLELFNTLAFLSGYFAIEQGKYIGTGYNAGKPIRYVDWSIRIDWFEQGGSSGKTLSIIYQFPGTTMPAELIVTAPVLGQTYSGTLDLGVERDWQVYFTANTTNYNRLGIGAFSLRFY